MMMKILLLVVIASFVRVEPRIAKVSKDVQKMKEESNSLDERLQDLQKGLNGLVGLINSQAKKIAELRSRQDSLKGEIMKRIDKEGFSSKVNGIMGYIHKMKKMMFKDVVKFPNPIYGDVNGKYFIQGYVEVLHNNIWGSICNVELNRNQRNAENVANVLCRMQGYESGTYGGGAYRQTSARKSSTIWLRYVDCKGSEASIGECRLTRDWSGSGCNHNYDIGIRCYL